MSNLRPLGNRVLVKRFPLTELTEGGIVLRGRDYPTLGKVIAVGNGVRHAKTGLRRTPDVEVGDVVQWTWQPNFDLKQIGPDLFLFDYSDLNLCYSEEHK